MLKVINSVRCIVPLMDSCISRCLISCLVWDCFVVPAPGRGAGTC